MDTLSRLVETPALEKIAEPLSAAVRSAYSNAGPVGREIKNSLHGVWLGHPLHPVFTDLPIGDPAVNPSASIAIFLDSREAVDKAVVNGVAAGGAEPKEASDYGFMYQRQLTDPDGHVLEFGWMDPNPAPEQD